MPLQRTHDIVPAVMDCYCNRMPIHYFFGYYFISFIASLQLQDTLYEPKFYLGAIGGWYMADFVSYFMHMFIDSSLYTKLLESSPRGVHAIVDTHHIHPLNYSLLLEHELISLCYPILFPVLIIMMFLEWQHYISNPVYSMYAGFKISLIVWSLLGGHIHKWVHERHVRPDLPWIIKKMQDYRIILWHDAHNKHHQTFDCQFSLVNGYSQLILDPIYNWFQRKHVY